MPQIDSSRYGMLGIGNALVDLVVEVSPEFLARHKLSLGTFQLAEPDFIAGIVSECAQVVRMAGGACANTLTGFAQQGGAGCFAGRIARDNYGADFASSMEQAGLGFRAVHAVSGKTGHCLVMVTPNAQRTLCASPGVASDWRVSELPIAEIQESLWVLLEGYLLYGQEGERVLSLALARARSAERGIALTLSDIACVRAHNESFRHLLSGGVDLVFGNEDEFMALFGTASAAEAGSAFQAFQTKGAGIACITRGADGVLVIAGAERFEYPALPVQCIDTTGAGDAFAAGFMSVKTRQGSIQEASHAGLEYAARVIAQLGPHL